MRMDGRVEVEHRKGHQSNPHPAQSTDPHPPIQRANRPRTVDAAAGGMEGGGEGVELVLVPRDQVHLSSSVVRCWCWGLESISQWTEGRATWNEGGREFVAGTADDGRMMGLMDDGSG